MPDLSILTPAVATGVVRDLTPDENFTWYGKVPTSPLTSSDVCKWTIEKGARTIAKPNVPDAEANMVKRKGKRQVSSTLVRSREKELVPGSELNFTQVWDNTGPQRERAEAIATKAMKNLHDRATRLIEWSFWKALQNELVYEDDENGVSVDVDYHFTASHKAQATTSWDAATPVQLREMITAYKKLLSDDGKVRLTDAYCSQHTIDVIFDAFAKNNSTGLMTEQNKQDYQNGGELTNFMGIAWHVVQETYDTEADATVAYMPENRVIFGNFTQNNPLELAEGTSGDTEIPQDLTGLYSKSWDSHDPSGRTFLVGSNFLPVIYLPDQFACIDVIF